MVRFGFVLAISCAAGAAAWRPRGGGGGGGIGRFTGGFGGNVSPLPGEETGIFFLLPKKRHASGNLKETIKEENAAKKKVRKTTPPKRMFKLFGVRVAGLADPVTAWLKPMLSRGAIEVRPPVDVDSLRPSKA